MAKAKPAVRQGSSPTPTGLLIVPASLPVPPRMVNGNDASKSNPKAKEEPVTPPKFQLDDFAETAAERIKRRRRDSIAHLVYDIAVSNKQQPVTENPSKRRKVNNVVVKQTMGQQTASVRQTIETEQVIPIKQTTSTQQIVTVKQTTLPAWLAKKEREQIQLEARSFKSWHLWYENLGCYEPIKSTIRPTSTQHAVWRQPEYAKFAQAVVQDLSNRIPGHAANVGLRQMKRIVQLLNIARPADDHDGPWLSTDDARATVAPQQFYNGPIFLEGQQTAPLMSVQSFLDEMYSGKDSVSIQDPSISEASKATRAIQVWQLKERFAKPAMDHPYNCLELPCPYDDGVRPSFLNGEDCRLLTKLKGLSPNDPYFSGADRRKLGLEYKEPEKWALLAEAGALTEPHQDSHGFGSFITVNQGLFGFGWLMNPDEKQRKAWVARPHTFCDGQWRYVVLRPGQTVYFPAGTVHFVFRHRAAGQTLAFGGHVLRKSTVHLWLQCIMQEKINPAITNEELTSAARRSIAQVIEWMCGAPDRRNSLDSWKGPFAEQFWQLSRAFG